MTEAADRRVLILRAAERLLQQYGPPKTTIADVARAAGVGVGTVYLEFSSKDAIVEELARERHRAVLAAMRAAGTAPERTFRERLSGAFDARLEAYLTIAGAGAHACDLVHCGGAAAPATPGVQAASQCFRGEELALIADILRRGSEAGELAVRDPEATARAVLRIYAGFAPPWVTWHDREEVRRAIAPMHEIVLYGVVCRAPPRGPGSR
jgi:AcrR family transcriptional regulator